MKAFVPTNSVKKPTDSRIESFIESDEIGLILPVAVLRSSVTWFFLVFTIIWNVSSYAGFYAAFSEGDVEGQVFWVPFMMIGAVTFCIFLYLLKAEISILIDRNTVMLSRKLFGKSFNKTRPFKQLRKVESVHCYKKNRVWVHGVGLIFADGKCWKFGPHLKEEEKAWILSEITQVKNTIRATEHEA